MSAESAERRPQWILIPVHNRRETTLPCLRHLQSLDDARVAEWLVIDCGSTDGTADEIRRAHPRVELLMLGADVWWTGAIAAGMRHAMGQGAEQMIWLNDDTLPEPGAIAALVAASTARNAITGAICFLPDDPIPGYSGMRSTRGALARIAHAGPGTITVDALHGNLVCVPAIAVRAIGFPDASAFPHAGGDFDYTLRASRAGVPVLLVGSARAQARPNLSLNYRSWLLSDVPVFEWWRLLFRPRSYLHLGTQWRFHWRHWGPAGGLQVAAMVLRLAAITVTRTVVPLAVLRRVRGDKSAAWRHEQRHAAEK